MKDETIKVTISLSKASVDFVKKEEKKYTAMSSKKGKDNSLFCSINRYIFPLSKPAPTL